MAYKTGRMPNTDFRYEEFEGLLGGVYLSLRPLATSSSEADRHDYARAKEILDDFAKRYEVQLPEDAAANHRAPEEWGNARTYTLTSLLGCLSSFWRDFGIAGDPKTFDGQRHTELGRLILQLYERHGIVQLAYGEYQGKRVPTHIVAWNDQPSRYTQTLTDILQPQ